MSSAPSGPPQSSGPPQPRGPIARIERTGDTAVVHLQGDLTIPAAGALYHRLRSIGSKRRLREVTLDFAAAGRVDSSGIAAVSVAGRELARRGVHLEIAGLDEQHRAAFDRLSRGLEILPGAKQVKPEVSALERAAESVGEHLLVALESVRAFARLTAETLRQTAAVITRRGRMPAGAVSRQIAEIGADGVPIIVLLSCLLGATVAFQTILQLEKLGAGVFVADAVGFTMVRELAPLVSAIVLTGRTGAAIAAELGTMRVRSEIDALSAMGISPVRFLVVPRLLAITLAGPALALIAMAVAIFGGFLVATASLDMPPAAFWARLTTRVELGDFLHGMSKSFVFSWIVGLAGSHFGMRAGADAGSVGAAATRTVVTGISLIILVDAIFATASSLLEKL